MPRTLKALIELSVRATATGSELEAALVEAETLVATAEAEISEAERKYQGGLLDADEGAVPKIVAAKSEAGVRRDRAQALVDRLGARLLAVRVTEDDARRKAAYEAALARRDTAAKRLRADYEKHARAIADIIREIAEADALIDAAREDLPSGAEYPHAVEELVRWPTKPREIISEKVVSRWVFESNGNILGEQQQTQVGNVSGNRGLLPSAAVWGSSATSVVRRRFTELRYRVEDRRSGDRLAESVRLPALAFDAPAIWEEHQWHPGLSPQSIMHHAAQLRAATADHARLKDQREIVVELIPLIDSAVVEAA